MGVSHQEACCQRCYKGYTLCNKRSMAFVIKIPAFGVITITFLSAFLLRVAAFFRETAFGRYEMQKNSVRLPQFEGNGCCSISCSL